MGTVTVTALGKAYKRYPNRWARLAERFTGQMRHEKQWILDNISFNVAPGEAVGIIGINGAGKSTLLKLITGTTQPTRGAVNTVGHVAALLELGMGFHPDFTGRQNAVMAGQLLGFSVDEIAAFMPAIEAFAEIGDYLDQPVRIYSSGMQMRLAFSVAVARRPDILIVDEALSVGDAYFQQKSFERIRAMNAAGTTLLIVSHDKQAIQSICSRAILLNGGRIAMQGEPEAVMDYYNALLADRRDTNIQQQPDSTGKLGTTSGTGEARVHSIALVDQAEKSVELVDVGEAVTLVINVETSAPIDNLILGYSIKDRLGQVMYGTNTAITRQPVTDLPAGSRITYRIDFSVNLGPGNYSVQTALVSSATHLDQNYEWRDRAFLFTVVNNSRHYFIGCNWIEPHITLSRP